MPWDFKRVAVVGSGAIGLYYGGRLAKAGFKVNFLARSGFELLEKSGLVARSIAGDFHLPQVSVSKTTREIGAVDLVIVALKSTSNPELAGLLPPLVDEHTVILTLQNGLGNCEHIASIVRPDRICGGLCFVCINRLGPNQISHTAGGRLTVGDFVSGMPERTATIVRHLNSAGIPANQVSNLARAQWEKLVWNIPFNGLAVAEGGLTTDKLLANPETEREIRTLMAEVISIARAEGHELDSGLIRSNIDRTYPMGAYRPSTMIDLIEGREIELNAIWLEPLRRAKEIGIDTPALERLILRIRSQLRERPV